MFRFIVLGLVVSFSLFGNVKELVVTPVETIIHKDRKVQIFQIAYPEKSEESNCVLICKKLDGTSDLFPVKIQENGDLTERNGKKLRIITSCAYGEALEFILIVIPATGPAIPIGKKTQVPFPIVVTDGQRKLEVTLKGCDGESFCLVGEGFGPQKSLVITSQSCHEIFPGPMMTDNEGKFRMYYLPAVIGEKEGPFQITLYQKGEEPMVLNHVWGKIALSNPQEFPNISVDAYKTLSYGVPEVL